MHAIIQKSSLIIRESDVKLRFGVKWEYHIISLMDIPFIWGRSCRCPTGDVQYNHPSAGFSVQQVVSILSMMSMFAVQAMYKRVLPQFVTQHFQISECMEEDKLPAHILDDFSLPLAIPGCIWENSYSICSTKPTSFLFILLSPPRNL